MGRRAARRAHRFGRVSLFGALLLLVSATRSQAIPCAPPCDDQNPCTDDTCDTSSGQCVFTNDDTNSCQGISCATPACSAGACVCSVPLALWRDGSFPNGLIFGFTMGASWGDYDADGRIDLFNAYSGTLWRNLNGTSWQFAENLSTLIPPAERRYGSSFGDYDNDGLPDIAVAPREPASGDDLFHLFHNLGGGAHFEDIAGDPSIVDVQPYSNAETLCWADVDGDRNLDLFVPVYPAPNPGSFFLYNLGPTGPGGAYRFAEMSGPVGVDNAPGSDRPEGAQYADVDFDGDVDLYANGTLYQNVSTPLHPSLRALPENVSGIGLRASIDEGAMFADYDLDGDFDVLVAYTAEGAWIWENQGDGTFFAAEPEVIEQPLSGRGLGESAEDWDNDGDIDWTTREVFRRNLLVEQGARRFAVEAHTIPFAHIHSAIPAWGDWDRDGDLDCAIANWNDVGHLYENRLYTSATPAADRRYVRVRVVRDAAAAPRGLETEYGAVAEVRLLDASDGFRRKKFVASSHGYLNQNEYALHFALPPRPGAGPEVRFGVSVDFPGPPSDGLWRVDERVNPVLGAFDLGTLVDREIRVARSGRVVVDGVRYDPLPGASPRLRTTAGGLALADPAHPLPPLTPAPDPLWHVGLAFDTSTASAPIALREILLDGQLALPDSCGSGTFNLALWDVTGDPPVLVSGGAIVAKTSERNTRSYFPVSLSLPPGHSYRLVAHVTSWRPTQIAAPVEEAGLTVRGGLFYSSPACSSAEMKAAAVDPAAMPLALRFDEVPAGTCVGRAPSFCDDGDPCTDDACGGAGACVHTTNSAPCDDGSSCTQSDRCALGVCSGSVVDCNDANPCTTDGCDPALGCTHANNDASCNDGNFCTQVDACSGGHCVGIVPRVCDDSNPCTRDSCNPVVGCVFTPDNTNPCSDQSLCTTGDACVNGHCVGTPVNCNDGVDCTADVCLPPNGCVHTAFEVGNVRFSGKTTLIWDRQNDSGSAKYDVVRGNGSELPVLGNGAGEVCLANELGPNSLSVSATPAPNSSFWYLVRARTSNCGNGTYGFKYVMGSPVAQRILDACP